ncbi:MAG: sigma-70 family RNA polymerase sigma factor [Isosphaeraceae bacterium]
MSEARAEIGRLFETGVAPASTDAQLLRRFAAARDQDAFALLVARHGGMVMAVCRGVLGNPEDAEDAFQATFLILARRAGSFPVADSVGGWLRRVALRVARQARREAGRRIARERSAPRSHLGVSTLPCEQNEMLALVRDEVGRLPERYRIPVQLCDLQGLTREEAAASLGWPPGTVAGRLARGRLLLQRRLRRRGLGNVPAVLPELGTLSSVWTRALESAREAGTRPGAAALADRVGRAVPVLRVQVVVTTVAFLGLSAWAMRQGPQDPIKNPQPPASRTTAAISRDNTAPPLDPDDPAMAGVYRGRVIDPDGRPVANARVYAVPARPAPDGPGQVRVRTNPDGRFEFHAPDLTFRALDGLPARGEAILVAAADGYGPDWVYTYGMTRSSFRSHSDPVRSAEWTLTLAPDDVPLRGRLLGEDGKPVAQARVRMESLQIPRDRDLTAHLSRLANPSAMFMSPDSARSLTAVGVLPGVSAEMETDDGGRFEWKGLGRDRLAQLVVTATDHETTRLTVMTRNAPEVPGPAVVSWVTHGADFSLRLKPGRTINGVVRGADDGTPLAGAAVGPTPGPISVLQGSRYPNVSGVDGRFSVSGLSRSARVPRILAVPADGQPYFAAEAEVDESGTATVKCPRGISYRLRLRNAEGKPVQAEVEYSVVMPNPKFREVYPGLTAQSGTPLSVARRESDGTYVGVAMPGPGVVTVRTPASAGYRPGHCDMKAFFAPGRTAWTPQERISAYGSDDTISVETFYGGAWLDQHEYAAIIPVNPPEGSEPIELTATLVKDQPRSITLVDLAGNPVVGVTTEGLTYHPWDREPPLRTATIPIVGLHPGRPRRVVFRKDDRKLVGMLFARGPDSLPGTVRLQQWATVTGRVVGPTGEPLSSSGPVGKAVAPAVLGSDSDTTEAVRTDPKLGRVPDTSTSPDGRFRIEGLVPGLRYSAEVYSAFKRRATAFRDLTLSPGEVRDLGDIRFEAASP